MAAGTHRQRKHSVGGAAKFYEEVLAGADAQHAEESKLVTSSTAPQASHWGK